MEFFNPTEIASFANMSDGGDYDSDNDEQKVAGKKFSKIIYPQIEYWASNVVERLVDFKLYRIIKSWQIYQRFHSDFYVKILHKDHSDIKVYFTVGVNVVENVLICKLDLNPKQGNDIKTKWSKYWLGKKCNWEKLISETVDFINKNRENYYSAVFDIAHHPSQSHGGLIQREFPTGIEKLPDIKREFKGIDINFNDEQARKNIIGNIGERLVIEFEQQKLKNNNLQHLIPNVAKAKDGCGYDIRSYDKNGEELFIEIKSTVGDSNTPFFISANEVAFHKAQKGKSIIYRVYNLDVKTQQGEFFIISDWEAEATSDTVVFRSAPIKKEKTK